MKERIWLVYTEIIQGYDRIPGFLICNLIYALTFYINSFPVKDGVLATLSPQAIITGMSIEFSKHCLLDFGEYVHSHEDREKPVEYRTLKALEVQPHW